LSRVKSFSFIGCSDRPGAGFITENISIEFDDDVVGIWKDEVGVATLEDIVAKSVSE
jgi:hypothetical protein